MRLLILSVVLIVAALAACAKSGGGAVTQGSNLVSALIEALNTKDEAKLRAFVLDHASDSVPVETRVSRMKQLAMQGAPFKIVRSLPDKPGEQRAVIEDMNGMQLGIKIQLTTGANPKMERMLAGPPEALDAPPAKDYSGWKDLASLNESIRTDTVNPAMAVAVIRDGKLEQAVSGTRTEKGTETVGIDEPWSIGSIGKPICSTIIGKLIEMGKLRWDMTLAEALPGIPMKDGYKAATLEQIMHHRGGIPEDSGMRKPDVDRIVASETNPTKIRMNYARDILGRDPISKPGETFAYSNAGYVLLGVIAEKVMGKPYETLVKEYVFAPLGLKHSYTGSDKLPTDRPSGHERGPDGLTEANFAGPLEVLFAPAGGGLFMSVSDLARFGEAHMKGLQGKDGLLKSSTFNRLHAGIPEADPKGRQYACGWGIEKNPGIETMHTHNGSNGTMRAQVAMFPESGLVIASFVNAGGEGEPSPPLQAILAIAEKYAKR